MKKIILIAIAIMFSVSTFAQDWKHIYNKYSEEKNVSAVYISPAMFRLMGRIPDINVGEGEQVNISPIIKSLNGFYLLDSENPAVSKNIGKEVESMVKAGKYELLMEAKDDGQVLHIYTTGKGDVITGFVLVAYEDSEATFICLDGQISRKSFEDLVAAGASYVN